MTLDQLIEPFGEVALLIQLLVFSLLANIFLAISLCRAASRERTLDEALLTSKQNVEFLRGEVKRRRKEIGRQVARELRRRSR